MPRVQRIYVEKKETFNIDSQGLLSDLRTNLGIAGLTGVRTFNRYDISGLSDEEYKQARRVILAEAPVDNIYDEKLPFADQARLFAIEYLPGQYDQRADSAAQCVQILTQKERPLIRSAKVILLEGNITNNEFARIKSYTINPVDSREAALDKPDSLEVTSEIPDDVPVLTGFIDMTAVRLDELRSELGLAMTGEDLLVCQNYFQSTEKRDPTLTEIRVIDTYWSDHCRHTTFFTRIEDVVIEPGAFTKPIATAYENYLASRAFVYGKNPKAVSLMDIAIMGMKELKKRGLLPDLDESDEINACSIVVPVDVDGKSEEWLVMFKNETHNHPTEIEPFGGAATCLGGAIRDPLSGRAYVYQAMRVTGSGDPRVNVEDTLPGKLPQRKITIGAATGYSSYGNQIGLATGQVAEIYNEGFIAKRMEIGAVVGAAPRKNVVRQEPIPGDVVILVGGRTGRDGCGGATGSSKEHTTESLLTCGAEVQKGNAPTERKIQRLFRRGEVSVLIKRCNDFGAGGVSVAIGELTDGLMINLDAVPKKYDGLDGTELAISESQERMAVVVAKDDAKRFIKYAQDENLEATIVATVTARHRLQMEWRGQLIVDISRDFLNTNGAAQHTTVTVTVPADKDNYFALQQNSQVTRANLEQAWLTNLQDLNVCSQKGLVERFDSTIGAGSVLMPFGGKYQTTPAEGMVAKIPLLTGETTTASAMAYGYNPELSAWSPFHGAAYAIVEAVAKIVAMGGDYKSTRLTLQEYFEKLGKDRYKWGKPFSALLGAFHAQQQLGIPAIGGKDSMSGTFMDLSVPPTLVAFAINIVNTNQVVSAEFKAANSKVVLIPAPRDQEELPCFDRLKTNWDAVTRLIQSGKVKAAATVRFGGIAATISKMAFGNGIGMIFANDMMPDSLFSADYGSIIIEIDGDTNLTEALGDADYQLIGYTKATSHIVINGCEISLDKAYDTWAQPLEAIFPTKTEHNSAQLTTVAYEQRSQVKPRVTIAKPRVLIPVFPGTNCEYDSARAFELAGGIVETVVVRNLTTSDVEQTIGKLTKAIDNSQIIMLPGGFSAGDEPDGSGKFIATMFRNPNIKDAVMRLLKQRDGLILGICNGFQALIKLGLVPYGEIRDIDDTCPTLTYNKIGRHVSTMVNTKVVSTLSPWFNNVALGDIHTIAVSHGEGRFVANQDAVGQLRAQGQIATQYVDLAGNPTYDNRYNPNGSVDAIEAITSPDGRVLGKMGHSERVGSYVAANVHGNKDQGLFSAGIRYFQ